MEKIDNFRTIFVQPFEYVGLQCNGMAGALFVVFKVHPHPPGYILRVFPTPILGKQAALLGIAMKSGIGPSNDQSPAALPLPGSILPIPHRCAGRNPLAFPFDFFRCHYCGCNEFTADPLIDGWPFSYQRLYREVNGLFCVSH